MATPRTRKTNAIKAQDAKICSDTINSPNGLIINTKLSTVHHNVQQLNHTKYYSTSLYSAATLYFFCLYL